MQQQRPCFRANLVNPKGKRERPPGCAPKEGPPGKGPQGRAARQSLQAVHIWVAALLKAEGLRSTGDLLQGQQRSV